MSTSIIRSRTMLTKPLDRNSFHEVEDGAILQEEGIIVETGTYEDLSRRFPNTAVVGSGREIMVPGFVNGHHHVGLTPVQLGSPDMPLELWFVTRMVTREVDLYLDTLFSAFEMISSGITTVQHIHGWMAGDLDEVKARSRQVLKAYDDIGMRVSYCYAVRDQNNLVYQNNDEFVASLPKDLQGPMGAFFDRTKVKLEGSMDLFKTLFDEQRDARRTKIQLAPANLHWCSDKALETLAEASRQYDVPLHMHLVETAFQKEYAMRRGGSTAFDYLERFGLHSSKLTLGHGVWLNEADIEKIADTGVCICHNCSSNFRLRSGIAPLNRFEAKGVNTAIGLDEAGINDDRDMLQEMRLVLRAHRIPGQEDDEVPGMGQVLRMATLGGARTTPFGETIGTLEVGKAADLSLIDYRHIAYPYLDEETPLIDALLQRAKTEGVKAVMCDGEVIYSDGTFTRVDKPAALQALYDQMNKALSDDEVERRQLSKALLPHVRQFYRDYIRPQETRPFYRQSSRD
jgi:cytosine/adenosine deaminase-related metal-dependent hydrolase